MGVAHEPWLVGLSLVVAIQGAYVGLSLAAQLAGAAGMRRRLLLAASAVSLAVAVWSMHFVGMLAMRLPFAIDYLVFPTLLSFLVCVIVVGAAIFAASAGPPTPLRLGAAAVFMGAGIASMHYIGMTALHASAHMHHAPALVVASVAVGVAASGLALWLAGGSRGRPPLLLSAAALGTAIAGMHYTAMAGLTLTPFAGADPTAPIISSGLLAIIVAVVAFLVSGVFLLALVPERVRPAAADHAPAPASPGPAAPATDAARPVHGFPVERDGVTRFIPADDIVAIHANAHYTYLYDGAAKLFCPLPISEVESRLDADRFLRVHRSHIVRADCIARLRRSGDSGVVELAGPERVTVPVSRGRMAWLRARLGVTPDQAAPERIMVQRSTTG